MAKNKGRKQGGGGRETPGKDTSEASASGAGKGERGKGREENVLLEWTKSIIVALVLFFFLRSFLVHTFVIISGSMEETLLVGDLVMVNRAAVGSRVPGTSMRIPGYSEMERGDILVCDPPHEEDLKLVKRLMGLPGETVEMHEKVFFVNGEAQEEPYARHTQDRDDEMHPWMSWQENYLVPREGNGRYRPTRDNWGPLVIPEGYFFMLGDNRDTSLDSRYWGFLEEWRLEGRAILVYFSYNKDSPRPFPWLREIRWGRVGDLIH
jgi:signal peptidase I